MEEYLSTTELSERIKMAPGTIRNLVWRKEFQENVHYLKPTPKKILFLWSAVEQWIHRNSPGPGSHRARGDGSLINV
jgi:hypothetical protein